jgi:hypothetical protein
MRSIAIVMLAALAAAFGAACMGDDEGEQSRRPAAFGDEPPPGEVDEPQTTESKLAVRPTVTLRVSGDMSVVPGYTGWVRQEAVVGGYADGGQPTDCAPPATPPTGTTLVQTTCTWKYSTSTTAVDLRAFPSSPGTVVGWFGCLSTTLYTCRATFNAGNPTITAQFKRDPKGRG